MPKIRLATTSAETSGAKNAAGMALLGAYSADPHDVPFLAVVVVTNGLIGSACGVGLDALVDNRRTLYQRDGRVVSRLAPIVAPGVRGAAITVRW